jgi:hypothetical protein
MATPTSALDTSPSDLVDRVADRVAALGPRARGQRWASLSACVLDSVWSIGARYDALVMPVVRRVLEPGAQGPLLSEAASDDVFPLPRFVKNFPDEHALIAASRNRQRTSTRNGVTKAQAALSYARILVDNGIHELGDVQRLAADPALHARVDRALSRVPGEGLHGIRRGYFWLLCGDDQVKPDRMVLRWLAPHGVTDPSTAKQLLLDVAARLSARSGAPVTPRAVDHAIWLAARRGERA